MRWATSWTMVSSDLLRLWRSIEEEVAVAVDRLETGISPWLIRWALLHDQAAARPGGRSRSGGRPRTALGADQVGEHAARADRRQLVDVADQDQPAARGGTACSRWWASTVSSIDASSTISRSHGERVLARRARTPSSAGSNSSRRWIVLASPPVASASRLAARPVGAARQHLLALLLEDGDDAADQRRLAGARAAGDHQHLARQPRADRLALLAGELDPLLLLEPVDRPVDVDLERQRRLDHQRAQAAGDPDLGRVERLRGRPRLGLAGPASSGSTTTCSPSARAATACVDGAARRASRSFSAFLERGGVGAGRRGRGRRPRASRWSTPACDALRRRRFGMPSAAAILSAVRKPMPWMSVASR